MVIPDRFFLPYLLVSMIIGIIGSLVLWYDKTQRKKQKKIWDEIEKTLENKKK